MQMIPQLSTYTFQSNKKIIRNVGTIFLTLSAASLSSALAKMEVDIIFVSLANNRKASGIA